MATLTAPPAKILCVEDDPDSWEVLRIILRYHDVSTAATMAQGLELARLLRFDLYVLDGTFPDGSGVELCRKLRDFDNSTPILFFSGSSENSENREAMIAGAQLYLKKPNDIDVLGRKVELLLKNPANQAQRGRGFQPGGVH